MRSTKPEAASVGAFAPIVAGFGFSPTDEGTLGPQGRQVEPPKSCESVWSEKGVMK
jgi:hypothetical protein